MGARLIRALPPTVRYSAAEAGAYAWWLADRNRRAAVLANYAAVLGLPEDDPAVARVAARAFRSYGRTVTDFMLMGALSPSELQGRLSLDGAQHAQTALSQGRGAILALPHMGSWDFAAALASTLGYRLTGVTEPFPGSLNEAVIQTRAKHGMEVLMPGRAAVGGIARALRANQLVGLICDLPPDRGGVEVRLFDRKAVVPAGPAAIALKYGSPLIPAFSRRTGPGRYHVHVDPPLEPASGGRGDKDAIRELMQEVVSRFEIFIAAHPDQWYAFKPVLQ